MDIPLDDPTANKAAAKIQAGFRGHMTRKKMKDDKPREEVSKNKPNELLEAWKTKFRQNTIAFTRFQLTNKNLDVRFLRGLSRMCLSHLWDGIFHG